jgi:hypothetical protein
MYYRTSCMPYAIWPYFNDRERPERPQIPGCWFANVHHPLFQFTVVANGDAKPEVLIHGLRLEFATQP